MGLFDRLFGSSKARVPTVDQRREVPTIHEGQLHQLDMLDAEQRRMNSRRIALEGSLNSNREKLSSVFKAQADEADREPTQWYHQPEYYAARINALQNDQLEIRSELAEVEARLTRIRTERMELVEKMNAPAQSDAPSEVAEDQPAN